MWGIIERFIGLQIESRARQGLRAAATGQAINDVGDGERNVDEGREIYVGSVRVESAQLAPSQVGHG